MSKPTDEEIEEVKKKIEELNKVLGQTIPIEDIVDRRLVMLNQNLQNMERIMNEIKERQNNKGESMKIKTIELKDYKLFKGKRAFNFSDRLNLISGPNGSGKTILFNALKESITGEIPGVKIILEGEIDDFKNNLELIFIDEEQIIKNEPSTLDDQSTASRNYEALMTILEKRATNNNLPLVMDAHLFSIMNQSDREKLFEAILPLQTQIILFEHDFKGMKGGKRYRLRIKR